MSWFDRAAALLAGKDGHVPLNGEDDLQVAVAALLVEAALMDDRFEETERQSIMDLLCRRFAMTADQASALLGSAEGAVKQSTELYRFTRIVADKLDRSERARIVEMLWEVAYADGVLDPHEDAMIRKVAGLLYVSDFDRGAARRRVRERRGLGS